jgi:hypothetical protein
MNRIGRTLVVVGALLAALTPSALARIQPQQPDSPDVDTAPTIVSYQGRVTVSGVPHEGTGYFKFALVNVAGNVSYWSNDGSSTIGNEPTNDVALSVSGGLFNVLLGDTSLPGMSQPLPASVFNASGRYLRVWFTPNNTPFTLLSPDRRIGSTPYALNAETLDGQDSTAFALGSHTHFGQTWSGSAGIGLQVSNAATSGFTSGVFGESASTDGRGLYGWASAASGATRGVVGQSDSPSGTGVYGLAFATNGTAYGVYGQSTSTLGRGVYGEATATGGQTYGVYGYNAALGSGVYGHAGAIGGFTQGVAGRSDSTGGSGVHGYASATSGFTYGVYGRSDSFLGRGVYGEAFATGGNTYGVYGLNHSVAGTGVYGNAYATSGATYGVYGQSLSSLGVGVYGTGRDGVIGQSNSTVGYGVWGQNIAASGATRGVYGQSGSSSGIGVEGYAYAASGITYGVRGESSSTIGRGVFGDASATSGGTYGVYGLSSSTSGRGVVGYANATTGITYGVMGISDSPFGYGVYYVGGLGGTGMMAGIVETEDYGWRHLYAVEAPDNWFEDFGQAQLVDGKAMVTIEPIFAQTVNLAQSYHVFAMPLGNCPLYVAEKTATSFTVRTLDDRPCDAAFDYRIIAKRLGYEGLRLGPALDPATLGPDVPPEYAPRDVRGR